MFCPYCGSKLPDDVNFCEQCGQKVERSQPFSRPAEPPKKRSAKKWIVIGLIAAMLLALVLGGWLASCNAGDDWQDQYDLGMRYLSDGDYEEAVIAFLAAIDIDPTRPEAYSGAAEAYIKLDDYESAVEILEKGIRKTDDEDLMEELEELEEKLRRGEDGNASVLPTEPEATTMVLLPTRMEKTNYGETTTVWVEEYSYDIQGNMVELKQYKPDGSLNYTETYTYNDQGEVIRRDYLGSSGYQTVEAYTYDSLGRQIVVGKDDEVYTYELDDQGRLSYYQDDESNYCTYVYSEDGLSYVSTEYNTSGSVQEYTEFYLDDRGNVISTWRYTGDGDMIYRTDYVFDENNNHIQTLCYEFCSADHVGTTYTYTYDEFNNLIRVDCGSDSYYSTNFISIYTLGEVEVTESAAARLGQGQ